MPYKLVFTDEFVKALDKLDRSVKQRLPRIFEKLKAHPKLGKSLHGKWDYYRLRFLNYRLLYTVNEKESTVTIIDVGKRDDVYR